MEIGTPGTGETRSPLENFLRDYAEVVGGVWDEVEPQVYDLMLPACSSDCGLPETEPDVVRVVFDPEAVPEHPGSQLASFGTPLVNRLLADAIDRGRHVELFTVGLNLAPRDLAVRASRALTLPEGLELKLGRIRPMNFPQAVFWFEATFVSDQKEQDVVAVAIDLHYGRQVRHLDRLLDRTHLADSPWEALPEVRHGGMAAAYPMARDRAVRTVAALANTRGRELTERLGRQIERVARYYADLRAEVQERIDRARSRDEDTAALAARVEAFEREERTRISELRQKSALAVQLRLANLLVVQQPKLRVHAAVRGSGRESQRLEIVWDPLIESIEALSCPTCERSTFALELGPRGALACPACRPAAVPKSRPSPASRRQP